MAARLAKDPPDAVYTSPLSRARLMAERVAELSGVPMHVQEELAELGRGDWTFLAGAEVESRWPGAIQRYRADPETGNGPGGETESELCTRVWRAVDTMAAEHPGGNLVVVSHGHVLRVLMRRLLGWSPSDSMARFVPYFGLVEARLTPDGKGELLSSPEPITPDALRLDGAGQEAAV